MKYVIYFLNTQRSEEDREVHIKYKLHIHLVALNKLKKMKDIES